MALLIDGWLFVILAAELCKKLRQEQAQMRDEAEQLTSEIKSLEADVRYFHCIEIVEKGGEVCGLNKEDAMDCSRWIFDI